MKRYTLLALIVMIGMTLQAQTKLPVLRVNFPGTFTAYMSYVNGTMQLTDTLGHVVEMNAKFKTRGATARQYLMKPSFNMKLRNEDYTAERDSSLLGLRSCSSLILDAMAIDRICMRNRVCFDLWNQYSKLPYDTNFDGRNGTEGRFVEVYVNDEYKGIYCLSDRINRKLLNLKKVKDDVEGEAPVVRGVLYKSGTEDILDQNNRGFNEDYTACTVGWHNAWELTDPNEIYASEDVWEPLLDMHDNVKTYDEVKKYFFMENLVDYQLLVMAMSIEDNWGNKNHFFSIRNMQKDIDDPDPTESARRKFVVTPWDMDASIGGYYDGSMYDGNYSFWKVSDVTKTGGFAPFSTCQGSAEYKEMLKNRWAEVRMGALSVWNVRKVMYAYRDLFNNSGAWQRMTTHFDAQNPRPKYVNDLTKEVDLILEWYTKRFDEMNDYFGLPPVPEGIETISGKKDSNETYDISGVRVKEPVGKGVYIKNGKKMIR